MTTFVLGRWNAICQRCGRKFKSNQIALEWTGLRVCKGAGTNDCWDYRHPQDFLRGKPDRQAPPWVAPEPPVSDGNTTTEDDL